MSNHRIEKFIDQLLARELQSWERKIIRRALFDIYKYDYIKNYSALKNSMEETICDSVSTDWMRNFIYEKSENKKKEDDNSRKYHHKKLKIVLRYLLDQETGRLTEQNFKTEQLEHLAPSSVTEFFNPAWSGNEYICEGYTGLYKEKTHKSDENRLVTYIALRVASDRGYFNVDEIVRKNENPYEEVGTLSQNVISGWGIPSSQYNFLIILKHQKFNKSHCYINIGENIKDKLERIVEMYLVRNKDVIPYAWIGFQNKSAEEILSLLNNNILHMQRTDDFSCIEEADNVMTENDDRGNNVVDFKDAGKKKLGSSLLKSTRSAVARSTDEIGQQIDNNDKERYAMDEEKGRALFDASYNMDAGKVRNLLENGAPINYQDPYSGATAIHIAAYQGNAEIIDILLSSEWGEPCNLLIRDKENLLPSGCAAQGTGLGNTMKLAERLMDIEEEQGKVVGIVPRIDCDEPIDNGSDDGGPDF